MTMIGGYRVIERATRDRLGEGPAWSARRGALFWVDILAPALRSFDLASGVVSTWDMPEKIGWAIECADDPRFIVGLKSGFARLDLDTMHIQHIGHPEPDRPHNRLNDAKVDRAGRIWAGTMDDREVEAVGALYCLGPDLTWTRHDDGYGVTNGPAFSPDGITVYHTDSLDRTVFAFDLTDGALLNKRVFLRFEDSWGYPDGMCTDAAGGVWIAHWGGGRVSRFSPDGRLDRSIALPASQVTSCTFAGAGLDRLFVTSAAVGVEDEPLAGALFEVESGAHGLAPTLFAG